MQDHHQRIIQAFEFGEMNRLSILIGVVFPILILSCVHHENSRDVFDESLYEKSDKISKPGVEEYIYKYDSQRRLIKLLWDNGNVYGKGFYYGKNKVGKWTEYYENGAISNEFFLKNGNLDSTYKLFYLNGRVKRIERYTDGKKTGTWEYFDTTGKLITSLKY